MVSKWAEKTAFSQRKSFSFLRQHRLFAHLTTLAFVFTSVAVVVTPGQTPSPLAQRLSEKLKVSPKDVDGTLIVQLGTVLVVRKAGVMGVPMGPSTIFSGTYKNGHLHPPVSKALQFLAGSVTGATGGTDLPTFTPIAVGDMVHLVALNVDVAKDKVVLVVFRCDTCGDAPEATASRAAVEFQFPKGYLKSADAAAVEEVIDQVFDINFVVCAIQGDVRLADGSASQGAEILIERQDMKGTYKAQTDKKGRYIYSRLPIGMYKVSLILDGQIVDSTDDVRTRVGNPTRVDFGKATAEQQREHGNLSQDTQTASVAGLYVMTQDAAHQLQLNADGTLWLVQTGRKYEGTFRLEGNKIFGRIGQQGVMSAGTIQGDTIVDPNGSRWVKQGGGLAAPLAAPVDAPAPAPKTISIGDTTEQVLAGMGQPERIVNLGPKQIYFYKNLKVTFVQGKVTDVE